MCLKLILKRNSENDHFCNENTFVVVTEDTHKFRKIIPSGMKTSLMSFEIGLIVAIIIAFLVVMVVASSWRLHRILKNRFGLYVTYYSFINKRTFSTFGFLKLPVVWECLTRQSSVPKKSTAVFVWRLVAWKLNSWRIDVFFPWNYDYYDLHIFSRLLVRVAYIF